MKMQDRGKLINRLALVLLSIVVLELILIGDQVQPVKAIKKKIFLKKLKKVLPLLALVKPKKKIILVPIPFPMFNNKNNPHQRYPYEQTTPNMRPMTMITDGLNPPNSFTMISGEPGLVGVAGPNPMHMQQMPMTMTSSNLPEPTVVATGESLTPVMMPSMTMTIQSDASGGSAIELSMQNASSPSANLIQQQPNRPASKWTSNQLQLQQQQQQQHFDYFDEPISFNGGEPAGGEHYYSSPWLNSRPLASPAKLLRNERLRKQQQQHHHHHHQQQLARPQQQTISLVSAPTQRPTPAPVLTQTSGRLQQQQQQRPALMPVLVIKNQWHPTETHREPTSGRQSAPSSGQHQVRPFNNLDPFQRQIQQQINQALEVEELVPVGPPQLMPIYQTPNGQLHVSPPSQAMQQTTRPTQQVPKGPHQQQQQVAQVQLDQSSFDHEQEPNEPRPAANQSGNSNSNSNDSAEVQTIASPSTGNLVEGVTSPPASGHNATPGELTTPDSHQQQSFRPPAANASQRPSSPSVKGKQQQQQQQQPSTKRKPQVASGGY